jgi:hypothetical protein
MFEAAAQNFLTVSNCTFLAYLARFKDHCNITTATPIPIVSTITGKGPHGLNKE